MSVEKLTWTIRCMAELAGRPLSQPALEMMVRDLREYPLEDVMVAIDKARRDLRYFPTIADIIDRIPNGHPGPEEAWNMIPKHESSSVVWTDEMAQAYGACRNLIETDEVAARMAFLEKYRALLSEARFLRTKPTWQASLGHDQAGRESALKEAVALGRLPAAIAQGLLPRPERLSIVPDQRLLETSEKELSAEEAQTYVQETLKRIRGIK